MGASLALSLAAFVLVLGVAEVGFRLAGYSALYDVYSKPSLFWVHDPLLGWSHQPGVEGTYVGPRPFPIEFAAPVRINSQGLRGPEIDQKAPNEYRILVLGDSGPVGFEVAYEDTYTAILEDRLTARLGIPVRVINAAVRGYGTDQSYLYFRERGYKLEPDLVIFVHSGNDINDNQTLHRPRRPFGKAAFALRSDGSLELVGHPVPRYPLCSAWMLGLDYRPVRLDELLSRVACTLQVRAADRSALFSFVSRALALSPSVVKFLKDLTSPESQREGWNRPEHLRPRAAGFGFMLGAAFAQADSLRALRYDLTTALIRQLAKAVRETGAAFLVLQPKPRQFDIEGLQAEGIEFLALSAADPRPLMWQHDPHLNERGHLWMAQKLVPVVEPYVRASPRDLGLESTGRTRGRRGR